MSRSLPRQTRWATGVVSGAGVIVTAYGVGAIPFSNIAARALRGVDLRREGTGTVSGTGLYDVAGLGPLLLVGCVEVAKGAVGPLVAGRRRPVLAALAGGAAVAGHDWSPFLGWAGGRGISPALGALSVNAWPGSAVLLTGLALGRLAHQTSVGTFAADLALVPILAMTHGRRGALAGAAVLVPMLAKRVLGNRPVEAPPGSRTRVYLNRLVFDQDEPNWGRSW